MATLIDGRYYRVQIKAKNNKNFSFNEGIDIDEIFKLENAEFRQRFGRGFTLYEATLMKTKLTLSTEKKYDEQERQKN